MQCSDVIAMNWCCIIHLKEDTQEGETDVSQIVHPMLSSASPVLVQQGQLLLFDPSAGTLGACHN